MKYFLIAIPVLLFFSCDPPRTNEENQAEETTAPGADTLMADAEMEDLILASMIDNRLQIAAAAIAEQKAEDPALQGIAERFRKNHTEIQYYLGRLAQVYEVEIPEGLTPEAQATLDSLQALSGNEFEEAFIDLTVQKYQEDIQRHEELLAAGENVMERGVAEGILDTLHARLELAEQIQQEMN